MSRDSILREIHDERLRQIDVENFDTAHDLAHHAGDLAWCAIAYTTSAAADLNPPFNRVGVEVAPDLWPFDPEGFKPKGAKRDLVRAAALIVAELERMELAERRG